MSKIGIKCIDQVLQFNNMPIITAGNVNVDQVEFDFCPLWDGYVKVAVFFQQREVLCYSMVSADNVCDIPNSILKLSGKIYIAVTGVNANNQTRTTNILSYEIGDGIIDAVAPEDFPGTEEEAKEFYNNILTMCAEMQELYKNTLLDVDKRLVDYTYSKDEIFNVIYPVGSIYMSASPTDPALLFGGTTWESWGSGRVPVGVDTMQAEFENVEQTGGEKTHALSSEELPSHDHIINADRTDPYPVLVGRRTLRQLCITDSAYTKNLDDNFTIPAINGYFGESGTDITAVAEPNKASVSSAGGDSAHNNLQPYITCYMWKRTA